MERVERCVLCGSAGFQPVVEMVSFAVVRCAECGLHCTTPRPTGAEVLALYQGDYWTSARPRDRGYADYVGDADRYRRTFQRRLRHLAGRLPSGARVLEVGSAAGFFIDVARQMGFDVHGVEIAEAMVAETARRHGAERITYGTIADLPPHLAKFDAAVLFDVVEHVEDPLQLLRDVGARLDDAGWLLLETQNVSSLFARLMGARWQHYKLEHLYHFCPATLRRLLDEAGFELVHMTARDAGKYVSVGFILERSTRVHPVLPKLFAPLQALRERTVYVNPLDELLVVARKRAPHTPC